MKVIVVGAGITGVSAAEWLRRDGHNVRLIDRVQPGHASQASYGNCGIVGRSSIVPVSVPGLWSSAPGMLLDPNTLLGLRWGHLPRLLPWLTRFLWNGRRQKVLKIAEALAPLVHDSDIQHGALVNGTHAEQHIYRGVYATIYTDRRAFEKNSFSNNLRRQYGAEWETWGRSEINQHDPELSDRYQFAIAMKDYLFVRSPPDYVASIAGEYQRHGGTFLHGNVIDVAQEENGTASISLEDGSRQIADKVVLATGVWSSRLAKRLGHKTTLESERGYHIMLGGASHAPPAVLNIPDTGMGVCPMTNGLCFGGGVEFGGLDGPLNRSLINDLKSQIHRVYPRLRWDNEVIWMGQRPSTVDSLPLIGASPRSPSFVFAFGGQHIGLTMGPRLGRMVADLISHDSTDIDITPYRVNRFD